MPAVCLALHLVCGVSLYLQPQDAVRDANWPTHAVIALPQGWAKSAEELVVLEDGRPMLAQIEAVANWPDGSPKWLHAYGCYRYRDGKPAKYELEKRAAGVPATEPRINVSDEADAITVDTGAVKFVVARPFAGITKATIGDRLVLDGPGGPSLVDGGGIAWHTMHDNSAEVVVEQAGPAQVTIRATGWYQSAERRVAPFCRFTTRITAFAGSPVVKFDHATIFADDMRQHTVSELAFKFPLADVKGYVSGDRRGAFDDNLSAVWFNQVTADRLLTLLERRPNDAASTEAHETRARSPGWFSAESAAGETVLLVKDVWRKFPKEVKVGNDGLTLYAWPRHALPWPGDGSATRLDEIYKFRCFHSGPLLDSRLPNDYFHALKVQTDTVECKAEYALQANLEGVAMHNEFVLVFAPPAKDRPRFDAAGWQKLYEQNPLVQVSPASIAASGALGPVAAVGSDFPEIERAVHDGMIGYARSIERYGDYGWAIYGNTHSAELMNPRAAGVPGGRPSLHRVWSNNHYQHVSTSWRLFALSGRPEMLGWARIATDNYASIGQVRYDPQRGRVDGNGVESPGAQIKFHNPGAFYHCKALVPWGCRDYGMDKTDVDADWIGHWPDPSGLLYAWLIDANRWAKDGYELWLSNVKLPTSGTRREINTTFVHAITAYEYRPDEKTLAAIRGMAKSLSSVPLMEQMPGPIFEPTWLSRYHALFPDDSDFNQYLVKSAEQIGVGFDGVWPMALCATAYQITKNEDFLRRFAGLLARSQRRVFYDSAPDKRWDKYAFGPGPDRDGHFMLQWPWLHAALREAKIDALPAPPEAGQYFSSACRFDNPKDVRARGTRILVVNQEKSLALNVQATTLSGGDIRPTSLTVLSPRGQAALGVPQLAVSTRDAKVERLTRPSSWRVAVEQHVLENAEPGLNSVLVGTNEIGLFQPLTDMPEGQLLKSSPRSAREPIWHQLKLTRGYLLPLTSKKIELAFTAMGDLDGSQVSLANAQGQRFFSQSLRAGESATATLNQSAENRGPWLLDVYSDFSGYVRLTIHSDAFEPLLYGRRLQDLQLIQQKLKK